MTPDEIAASKRECRDLFLYLFTRPVEESLEKQQELIDKLIKLIWFKEKIDYKVIVFYSDSASTIDIDFSLDCNGKENEHTSKAFDKELYNDTIELMKKVTVSLYNNLLPGTKGCYKEFIEK